MFTALWEIIKGILWRASKVSYLLPPSSVDHAKESILDLQRERMQVLMRIVDAKAHLDSVTKKIELLNTIIKNDIDNDVYKTLSQMDIAASLDLMDKDKGLTGQNSAKFTHMDHAFDMRKTRPFSTISR